MRLAVLVLICLVSQSLGSPNPSPGAEADPYTIVKTVTIWDNFTESQEEHNIAAKSKDATPRESSVCAEGWTEFDHTRKCYKEISDLNSWKDALSACQSAVSDPSATLASVPDKTTSDFLINLSPSSSIWVGGFKNSNGQWAWTDGSQMTFNNWGTGQPNNCCGGLQDYVVFYSFSQGKWNDLKESKRKRAVCQYDKPTIIAEEGKFCNSPPCTGIMVTGDVLDGVVGRNVELLKDDGTFWCNLPYLPRSLERHTQNGLLACGTATRGPTKCYTFANGKWVQSHTLQREYISHSSWESSRGIVLLYGNTTDLLTETGSVDHFSLKGDDSASNACTIGIQDQDEVVITGGVDSVINEYSRTPVYNNSGFVKNYPGLNHNRFNHACGHFLNSNGNLVLLVTGGQNFYEDETLDSTEIFVPALFQPSWTDVGKLPSPRNSLAAVSLDNNVFVMGGYFSTEKFWPDSNATTQSEILKFNAETLNWTKVGDMQEKRSYHAVSVVSSEDVLPYCCYQEDCHRIHE